jgi:hypothetical protein
MVSWCDGVMFKGIFNSGWSGCLWRLAVVAMAFPLALSAQTDGAAKVIAMTGQVSVMRGNSPWALNEGDLIEPLQRIITGPNGSAQLRIEDGSTIDVYPNSQFLFRANRGDWRDLVDVILGKIKVKIEHVGNVPNHNTVRTPTAVIAVRGTIFDVDVNEADETTVVLCEEGRVEVYHLTMPGKSRFLDPGESVTIFKNQPLARSNVDRGVLLQRSFRAMSDALDQILLRRATGSAGASTSTGTSTTGTGDKGPPPPPTGATPAPPPPPKN